MRTSEDKKTYVMVGFVETKVEQTKIKQDFVGYALTKQVAGYKHFPGGARLPEKL